MPGGSAPPQAPEETASELVAKKREIFLVQMGLDTKAQEIQKLKVTATPSPFHCMGKTAHKLAIRETVEQYLLSVVEKRLALGWEGSATVKSDDECYECQERTKTRKQSVLWEQLLVLAAVKSNDDHRMHGEISAFSVKQECASQPRRRSIPHATAELQDKAEQREAALSKAEKMLDEDVKRFDAFLRENAEKLQEAVSHAETQTKAKQEKVRTQWKAFGILKEFLS